MREALRGVGLSVISLHALTRTRLLPFLRPRAFPPLPRVSHTTQERLAADGYWCDSSSQLVQLGASTALVVPDQRTFRTQVRAGPWSSGVRRVAGCLLGGIVGQPCQNGAHYVQSKPRMGFGSRLGAEVVRRSSQACTTTYTTTLTNPGESMRASCLSMRGA